MPLQPLGAGIFCITEQLQAGLLYLPTLSLSNAFTRYRIGNLALGLVVRLGIVDNG